MSSPLDQPPDPATTTRAANPPNPATTGQQPFSALQQLALCQQIVKVTRAKLPLVGGISRSLAGQNLAGQSLTGHFPKSLSAAAQVLEQRLASGLSLPDALVEGDSRPARILRAAIQTGLATNRLDRCLEWWTNYHLQNSQTSKSLRTALLYPLVLIAVTIAAIGFVVWHLIPEYRKTYVLFDQVIPGWLETIIWVREQHYMVLILIPLVCVAPLAWWLLRRYRHDSVGLPLDPVKRSRLQALATQFAAELLRAEQPLERITALCVQTCGAQPEVSSRAFADLQRQEPVPTLPRETSLILASVHLGHLNVQEAIGSLNDVAEHLQLTASHTASRQSSWIPTLVALCVGCLIFSAYVFLIYLPWVWLLQKISAP